ncbi:mitochondrial protein Pet127-domain-containing protein [Cytidiella melzeri]|nr:mitochondrial protein Pet127-domain-containing protein [Cytidiella melzeri]
MSLSRNAPLTTFIQCLHASISTQRRVFLPTTVSTKKSRSKAKLKPKPKSKPKADAQLGSTSTQLKPVKNAQQPLDESSPFLSHANESRSKVHRAQQPPSQIQVSPANAKEAANGTSKLATDSKVKVKPTGPPAQPSAPPAAVSSSSSRKTAKQSKKEQKLQLLDRIFTAAKEERTAAENINNTSNATKAEALQALISDLKESYTAEKAVSDLDERSESPGKDISLGPTSYLRRIEGFLKPSADEPVMQDLAPPSEQKSIARLAHGLDRVLFNPGVYWLQDPRSRVYNFPPWIQTIPKVQDFAFDRVEGFVTSSVDTDLKTLAKQSHARYTGSTSSLTGMLSQIYLMLSRERNIDASTMSAAFSKEPVCFTPGQKFPVAVKLNYEDGIYSTDSVAGESSVGDRNVLSWMGTMLEKFLTLPEEEFKLLQRTSPASLYQKDGKREAYRFVKTGKYVMRSQLDCYDPRLPGTGIFDIKTRAAMPIRHDILNYEENSGYHIDKQHGLIESFEREYYDLIRSAFLKYSFQARIGNMDGVLVAYHNTARIFGFQYIPLEEMDQRLYGNKHAGPLVFEKCVAFLEVIMDEITHHFPEQTVRCMWDAEPENGALNIWIQPNGWVGLGESPMVELKIIARNYVDDKYVEGWKVADHLPDQAWSVNYEILTSSSDQHDIRERYRQAVEKQNYIFDLPSGVNINEMEELWQQMDFGGNGAPLSPFKPEMFRKPGYSTKMKRKLALEGKERLERLEQESIGKPVVVYDAVDLSGLEVVQPSESSTVA